MLPPALQSHWQSVFEQLADTWQLRQADWPGFWQQLSEQRQQQCQRVLCLSDFVADSVAKEPDYWQNILAEAELDVPLTRQHFSQWLDQLSDGAQTEEDWHKALRLLRRRAQSHIIWRDLLRTATTLQTTRALSELADECVSRTLAFLTPQLQQRYGAPMGKHSGSEQHLQVLGMGKLGAYELNLSSDIDLIFTYPESGDTQGPKVISNQEYFIKLGQKLIQALDTVTIDGFVFRTDMRLRPYGQSGPLVMNFASMEAYYQEQGRDWERYAMVKARVMTGEDNPAAQELLSILRPFTYRQYVDFSAFDSLRSMKAMINAEVRRRGLEMNVKLGPGGIREVEFIVQAFQLIRGGQDSDLQTRELCKVLDILAADGYLPANACSELKQAYLFLRNVEHAIQARHDEQTQQLPDNEFDQLRLAIALGFDDWASFLAELQQHRDIVSLHFSHIVASDDDDEHTPDLDHAWHDLWLGELHGQQELDFLDQFPCARSEEVQQRLERFRQSRAVLNMQQIGRQRLDALMPKLLAQLWQGEQPVTTLERIIPLLEAVLRRTAYLVLLNENPQALEQLVRLCGASSWVAEYIAATPLLLDELLVPDTLYRLPDKAELAEELHLRLLRIDADDLEQQMEQLRQFLRAHKLRAAACEVMEALPLMQVSDYLTWLAEVILEKVVRLAFEQMVAKYGYPTNADKEPVTEPEFAVIGYGKVGGLELSYSSDLDLVFLHNSASNRYTTGERSQDNGVFYTRMGQRIIHIMTTQTRSGDLYEVDMRLRPSGNSGMIVASMKAFAEYQQQHAWTWEHQALVRARVLCGSASAAAEFDAIRRAILARRRDVSELAKEVRHMREKMREHLGSKDKQGQQFQLKQDTGGIVDIEFLVQYGVLAWSCQHPPLLDVTDNMRLLDAFAATGLMDSQDQQTLQETYLSYRAETHRRALQKQTLLLEQERVQTLGFEARRQQVMRLWNRWLEADHEQPET
ncbi:glutamate-ammonia-ligase adenylyltransferase [Bacterioplanes sanyensis]|uniref:bifunctional [glutamate--ammonia ligase]-adenylyl-L-tyrosine phosphorylase/[glutamate--ammonia-ligase] adenylyltransferase n=1 Tax=Bacterioplanes sanyensis TaxID=1249553 RepID=UPI001673D70E|nr:bifunctional [glutamate--ammonia ligase]-adenylyl-L-tyrosine phosphorylase/[glutamate--ammonia-ligase] adenylyltransferase [Bacterioplanes sanyensis]GGY52821.1 glutamate-ammonia-ligase adenylyltransferase [Bacterioplanes sanyensis]